MAYKEGVETKTERVVVRVRPSEKKRLMAACREMRVNESEYVRACINRELAMSLDPAAIEALRKTFEKGMREVVGKIVDAAIEEKKNKKAG
jgi:hypothetical protein